MPSRRSFLAVASASLLGLPAFAANLQVPTGRVLLTVTGAISQTNVDETAVFDEDMLRALDWKEIETYTHYTLGLQTFEGPTLLSLLEELGVQEGMLRVVALDDYAVDIPGADAAKFTILLAMRHNGKPMRVRNKGPIWVIFPAASLDDIREEHESLSIWQLTSIDVTR